MSLTLCQRIRLKAERMGGMKLTSDEVQLLWEIPEIQKRAAEDDERRESIFVPYSDAVARLYD